MAISFNGYCYDFKEFVVESFGETMTIRAEAVPDSECCSVLFNLEKSADNYQMRLDVNADGSCHLYACKDGVRIDHDDTEYTYAQAHYDYGFYHIADSAKWAHCSYDNRLCMELKADEHRVYFKVNFPNGVKKGMVITEFNFKILARQLLTCIAKLFGYYLMSTFVCEPIDAICKKPVDNGVPKLNEVQLKKLEEKYPVAYQAYTSGVGVDDVMLLILNIVTQYPQ